MIDGQEFYPLAINYGLEFVASSYGTTQPDEIFYSPEGGFDRIPQNHFECNDPISCDQQLREHFQQIALMGFNTVRLVGVEPKAFRTTGGERLYKLKVRDVAPYGNNYYVDINTAQPEFTDAMSQRYLFLMEQMLDAAESAGLKVILLTGTEVRTWPIIEAGDQVIYGWDDAMLYSKLLGSLALALKDHPALMAYDLINEPTWRDVNNNIDLLSKAEVCEWTSLWYDAISTNDPNHLITLGGAGKHDIGAWDPAVMKLDFYSPHPYLEEDWAFANSYDMSTITAMYMAELHWLGASMEMPWMVGETSYSANDGNTDYNNDPNFICLDSAPEHHTMPFMHGSEAEQASFAIAALDATHASRGSGFSWWFFQDGRSNPYQTASPRDIRSNYFGALSYGDGTLSWRVKPMVSVVQTYQPVAVPAELPEPPPAYWNWHGLTGTVYRTYYLQDLNEEPVANGIAQIRWKYQEAITPYRQFEMWARAVSDENGILLIQKPSTISGFNGPFATVCKIDAPGAARVSSPFPWPNGHTFELNRSLMTYSRTIEGLSLDAQFGIKYAAWAELSVLNSQVQASGTEFEPIRFEARHWIHLSGEIHIDNDSETHIRTAKTFPDCSNPNMGMALDQLDYQAPVKSLGGSTSNIQLVFQDRGGAFKAYPNPCVERLFVTNDNEGLLSIRDSQAKLLQQAMIPAGGASLDTRAWAPGVYHLTLQHQGGIQTTLILKTN